MIKKQVMDSESNRKIRKLEIALYLTPDFKEKHLILDLTINTAVTVQDRQDILKQYACEQSLLI